MEAQGERELLTEESADADGAFQDGGAGAPATDPAQVVKDHVKGLIDGDAVAACANLADTYVADEYMVSAARDGLTFDSCAEVVKWHLDEMDGYFDRAKVVSALVTADYGSQKEVTAVLDIHGGSIEEHDYSVSQDSADGSWWITHKSVNY